MSVPSRRVEDRGREVVAVDDDLALADHDADLAGSVVVDVRHDRLLRAGPGPPGLPRLCGTHGQADGAGGDARAADGQELPSTRVAHQSPPVIGGPDVRHPQAVRSGRAGGWVAGVHATIWGSVFFCTWSRVTSGASSTSRRPSGSTSSTHRSVMIRCTTPRPVYGRSHSSRIL